MRRRGLQISAIALVAVVAIGLVVLARPRREPTRAAPPWWPRASRSTGRAAHPATARSWKASPTGSRSCPAGAAARRQRPYLHHPDALLFDITKRGSQASLPDAGITVMPGFGGVLSDDEIWAVIANIKSRWPAETQAAQAQVNAQAGAP